MATLRRNKKKSTGLVTAFLFVFVLFALYALFINKASQKPGLRQVAISSGNPLTTPSSADLAFKESYGFFNDISDVDWMRMKKRFQLTQPNVHRSKKDNERWSRYSNYFWANNFEPEFTCRDEFRLGKLGDGGKWVCDPHRIPKGSCLVYSVGSNGHYQFEAGVKETISEGCEIHVFDYLRKRNKRDFFALAKEIGVTFHQWGISSDPTSKFGKGKTFKQTFQELGHEGRTVDIMKIDCEKCEYTDYQQWFKDWAASNMTIRQVLIELHNSDVGMVDIMRAFQENGFVIFHKEANYMNGANAVEITFINLSPAFQKL